MDWQQSCETIMRPLCACWYFEFGDQNQQQTQTKQRESGIGIFWVKFANGSHVNVETWNEQKQNWWHPDFVVKWWLLTTDYVYAIPNPKHILNGFVVDSIISILFSEIWNCFRAVQIVFLVGNLFECCFENSTTPLNRIHV